MSPNNVQFWQNVQQMKLRAAYETYTKQEAQVYCEKDPMVHSEAFLDICTDYNVHPDNMEMHVREVEGWPLDEYTDAVQTEISEQDLKIFCGLA